MRRRRYASSEARHRYRRAIEVECDRGVAVAQHKGVRRSSVHREVACLHRCRIHRIAQVDHEVHRLRVDERIASRCRGGDGKANQLSISEGILLLCAADGHAPIHP